MDSPYMPMDLRHVR